MVTLTRMNGVEFLVNATMIELVESTPDTVITLMSGRKYVVCENAEQVHQLVTSYYQTIGLIGGNGGHWRALNLHES